MPEFPELSTEVRAAATKAHNGRLRQIFIRNCENCQCIIACQQYRARECVDCDTLLFASTAPVVEESKNMRFGCFRFFYFNLAQQFKSVNMSVYDNKWSEVYDFTPKEGNFSFLPLGTKVIHEHEKLGGTCRIMIYARIPGWDGILWVQSGAFPDTI